MIHELVPVRFDKIMQTRAYTVIVLEADKKKFAIYADPSVGRILQAHLTHTESARPMTHDLMNMIFQGFEITVRQIVLNDLQDTIYFARIFFEQQIPGERRIVEIDGRPSDCLALALMHRVPVYCSRLVLEQTIALDG